MLQQMREAQGWMIKGVLWAVVLAFVMTIFYSWGVQSSQAPTRTEAATILGHRVGLAEFQQVQSRLYQTYRNIFRNRANVDLREQFNFRQMALEQIATQYLLLRIAQQERLQVTDTELFERIATLPAFQDQGRFNPVHYKAVLRSQAPSVTPQQFETEQRRKLLLEKVYDLVRAGVQVTAQEAEAAYRREHEQVAVRYVGLVPSLFAAQVVVTDEAAQAHYDTHKGTYREPEQRQIRYVAVSPQQFPFTGDIAPDEIVDYYEMHQEDFTRQEQVRVRHILFKVLAHADEEEEAQIRTRAEKVLVELRNGVDFAVLARRHSEDKATAEHGGDLGYFARGLMLPAFEEAAFTLSVGQLSDLVRTDFGFHILRLEDKVAAGVKSLPEVRPGIITELRQQKAQDATLALVDELMVVLEESPDQFAALATQQDLPITTSPFVSEQGRIADLAGGADLLPRAFALSGSAVETVAGPDGAHYIFQVADIRPSTIPPFAAVQERVVEDLRRQKSAAMARQRADDWAAQVQTGTPLEELAAQLQVQVVDTELFKRNEPVPQFGRSAAFSRIAFGLQLDEAGAAHEGTRHAVLQMIRRQAADMQNYETEKQAYRQQLLKRKQQQAGAAFNHFLRTEYQRLLQEEEIVPNPQYVF